MSNKAKRRIQTGLTIFTFVALAFFAFALRKQIAETISNIQNVNILALCLLVPFGMLNYHAQVRLYQHVFGLLEEKLNYKYMYRVALELNFINTIFPSAGVSGFSYFGLRLKRHGISPAKATLAQMMKLVLIFASFEILLFVGLFLLAIGGKANDLVILVAGSLTTLLIIGTFGMVFIVGSKRRINTFFTFLTRLLNRLIHLVRPKHPETINIDKVEAIFTELHDHYLHIQRHYKRLLKPLMYALLANFAEVAAIYVVYVAFGRWINPGAVIIAYAMANFAGLVSVLPGGVGIYEALMTGVLATAGISASLSLPVTIMYRIIYMLIQLIPGYFFYHQVLVSRRNEDVAGDDEPTPVMPSS